MLPYLIAASPSLLFGTSARSQAPSPTPARKLGLATVVAALLAGSSIDLANRSRDVDDRLGVELTPYALWCTFATALTASIWRRNR